MISARILTGPVHFHDAETNDDAFNKRVEAVLNKGWHLGGSPTITYDPHRGVIIAAQAVHKESPGPYKGFVSLKDMPQEADQAAQTASHLYRLLVGPDSSAFCAFIEGKLNEGWREYGGPALAAGDAKLSAQGFVIAAQALTATKDMPYREFQPIGLISLKPAP